MALSLNISSTDYSVLYLPQSLTDAEKAQVRANIGVISSSNISLGIASDGLIYIFVDGSPVGTGIPMGQGGDVFGYIDENNNIVLNGNLVEGTYTIKYEMEDGSLIDIGNLELDNSVYYTITNNLTNCTNGNIGITSVSAGDDYIAVINPVDNTEITSITVTMGGKDITANAVIFNPACLVEILGVTGDVVITAVAEEKIVATNFFKASPTVNTLANASQDAMVIAGRMGSDNGYRVDAGPQALLTNYIEVQNGDEIVIRNATLQTTYSGLFDSMAATKAIAIFNPSTTTSGIVSNISSTGFTIDNASAKYVRICLKPDASLEIDSSATTVADRYDCSQIIVNIKRNGEWLTDNEAGPTNMLPLAVNANGGDYIGDNGEDGYNTGYKIRSSTGEEQATTGACVSGYIPATLNSRIYIKNIGVSSSATINNITLHNADKTRLFGVAGVEGAFHSYVDVVNDVYSFKPADFISDNSVAFFRFSCGEITDETIVTVNEEIA